MADLRYGISNSSDQIGQSILYQNNSPVFGLSSHLNLLEDFNPNRTYDDFHWIPYGIYYDMIDNRNDNFFSFSAVNDNVFGYTNHQFFQALESDINSMQLFRVRLLLQNANYQIFEVNQLFSEYHY